MAHQHYSYHFMSDFLAAGLVANGLSVTQALAFASCVMLVAFVAVLYFAAARLTASPVAGFLATAIFLFSGGLGFVYLFSDLAGVAARHGNVLSFLLHLPRSYTQIQPLNYQWIDPILGYLVPQRPIVFGLGTVLVVLVLLREGVGRHSWRDMAAAGLLVAIAPLWHATAAVALAVVALVIAALDARRVAREGLRRYLAIWLAFALPVLLVAVPTVLWMLPRGGRGLGFLEFRIGWMATSGDHSDNPIWFWLKNLGIFVPLALFALLVHRRTRPDLARFVAPFWVLFVIPNLLILQPWDFDNTKWFLVWFLPAVVSVAGLLAWLFARNVALRALAAAALVVLCLAGAADVWRIWNYQDNNNLFLSNDDLAVGRWVRDHTPPAALFLTASNHNHPVPTIGGRRIFLGYTGWLFSVDLPYQQPEREAREIYSGDAQADRLLKKERISYVVVGPVELAPTGMAANEGFFRARYPQVYSTGAYRIYRVA